jgi:hypothetical protein
MKEAVFLKIDLIHGNMVTCLLILYVIAYLYFDVRGGWEGEPGA